MAGVRFLGDVGGCVRSADLPVPVGVPESADEDSEDERALRLVARTAADFRPPKLIRSDGAGGRALVLDYRSNYSRATCARRGGEWGSCSGRVAPAGSSCSGTGTVAGCNCSEGADVVGRSSSVGTPTSGGQP